MEMFEIEIQSYTYLSKNVPVGTGETLTNYEHQNNGCLEINSQSSHVSYHNSTSLLCSMEAVIILKLFASVAS